MLLSRDRRCRVPAAATVLLSLLLALLVCSSASAIAAGAAGGGGGGGAGDGARTGVSTAPTGDPVAVAVAAGEQDRAPGCGRGAEDDDNTSHPATPPRGGSCGELLPALHDAHGASGSAWSVAGAVVDLTPERGPPPLDPPSPVDLSILRV
ncbi:hypothetical protein OG883_30600 [Streptomyces sp. NBC_01142]|uniref:hypothetical protein n=1 Tax=Streptomyces sp. NBC_01142 TaxID=2975865 RepID=UPI00224C7FDD|nr:hypothetical protein [Streptomyces sp. NBC_01142]MCX4824138.1 hypothetical protein [Streptomyces sp. NBC_01142]